MNSVNLSLFSPQNYSGQDVFDWCYKFAKDNPDKATHVIHSFCHLHWRGERNISRAKFERAYEKAMVKIGEEYVEAWERLNSPQVS